MSTKLDKLLAKRDAIYTQIDAQTKRDFPPGMLVTWEFNVKDGTRAQYGIVISADSWRGSPMVVCTNNHTGNQVRVPYYNKLRSLR